MEIPNNIYKAAKILRYIDIDDINICLYRSCTLTIYRRGNEDQFNKIKNSSIIYYQMLPGFPQTLHREDSWRGCPR